MKQRLLRYLACPACQGAIVLSEAFAKDAEEVIEGLLQCSNCKREFPVVRGVPRFADLGDIEEEKAATASSFGWEWKHFTQQDERYAEQLLGWLNPVTPEFFKGKLVLDGGCGKGRHTTLAAKWGAREVIAVDLSDAVDTAFSATRAFENVHIVQGDICRLPLGRFFDYAFSVGVLDHLPEPLEGFKSVASKIRAGGHLSAWIYGAENNKWITTIINPLRIHFTSRVNPRTLLHLSKIPTAILYLLTKLFYGPLGGIRGGSITRRLFYGDYLSWISRFGWREQHSIVFDHLVAPTAHYTTRDEFERWWRAIGAKDVIIGWHNKNSWRGFGRIDNSQMSDS